MDWIGLGWVGIYILVGNSFSSIPFIQVLHAIFQTTVYVCFLVLL